MLFSLCLPGRAWSSCDLLVDDPLADSLTNNVAQHQYLQYQRSICGGGGGGGGGVSVPNCTSGQYLSGSSCLYCSSAMPGCSACSSASVCTTCFSGYYKSANKCHECPTGCATCSSSSSCSSCESGYTLSSGNALNRVIPGVLPAIRQRENAIHANPDILKTVWANVWLVRPGAAAVPVLQAVPNARPATR